MLSNVRICFVAQSFPIQGRASDHSFLWPMARGLAQRGHSVTVISARNTLRMHELNRDSVQVHSVLEDKSPLKHLRAEDALFRKFVELHQEKPFDLVHSLDGSARKLARKKRTLGIRLAFDIEATQMAQVTRMLGLSTGTASSMLITGLAVLFKFCSTYFSRDRELLSSADGVFVATPQQKTYLERYYLYPDDRTYLVPYGLELSNLSELADPAQLHAKLGIAETESVVLTLSDMTEINSLRSIISAFEKVAIKKSSAKLVIIGNGVFFKQVEKMILDLALGSRVLLLGSLTSEEISDWLSLSDVYVDLGARSTGFDPTMIEAMAQKKLVIGSEVSPIAHVIEDGSDGFLIRPADHETLAHLLLECFAGGGLPVHEIGEKARQKVLHLFDPKRMVVSLEEAYRKILSQ